MKKGWETKTLEETCQFSNGLWKGEKPPLVNVGVIRNTNFTKEGTLDDSDIAYLDVEAKKFDKRRLKLGDIILEKSGGGPKQPVGRVVLFDKEEGNFSFSNFTAALRVLDPDEVDFRFLHKFLHWTYLSGVTEGMQSHSTGIRNLDGDAYKAIKFSFPPLAEQQRIVGLLDEAFEGLATAKANAEKNLQNARALFESHLQAVFTQRGEGWVEKSLGETCEMYQPKTIGTKDLVPNGPYPVFGANGVIGRYDKFNHEESQLLVTCRGATCGSVNISEPNSWITGNAMVVRPLDHSLDLKFLEFVFRGGIDISKAITGAAQPQITRTNLAPLLIRFPKSVVEQTKLAEQFESLTEETQRLARLYERKLAALEELKKSLLHQAFTGEL
jgi:type I restriction enzyme S subunit